MWLAEKDSNGPANSDVLCQFVWSFCVATVVQNDEHSPWHLCFYGQPLERRAGKTSSDSPQRTAEKDQLETILKDAIEPKEQIISEESNPKEKTIAHVRKRRRANHSLENIKMTDKERAAVGIKEALEKEYRLLAQVRWRECSRPLHSRDGWEQSRLGSRLAGRVGVVGSAALRWRRLLHKRVSCPRAAR